MNDRLGVRTIDAGPLPSRYARGWHCLGLAEAFDLDDEKHKLNWPAGQRMIDVMIDAGIDAPYSCREGVCGACACRLVSGKVEMAHNEVLEDADLADGYVLACQSIALNDQVSVDYG